MVKPAQRFKDANTAGKIVIKTDGNTTVSANNLLVSVDTSDVGVLTPFSPTDATAHGSKTVLVHNKPFNYTGNNDVSGAQRVGGSANVFVGDDIDQDIPSIRQVVEADEEDTYTPGNGKKRFEALKKSGVISKREQEVQDPPPTKNSNKEPSKFTGSPTTACGGIELVVQPPPPLPPLSGASLEAVQLSPNYTVGKLTRKPHVSFDNPLSAGVSVLSLGETVCNLKLLALNCLEPIRAKYPNSFVTNTWRPPSGNPKSQHPLGMAADIQFRGVQKSDYYDIALWIKDNVIYDQLLLEYKTTGTRLPWIHISFNKAGNRKQVLTLLNNATYSQGLQDLAAK